MTTLELLSNLRSKDIEIWADGDRLRYNAPKGALTPDLRKELAAHKSEILAILRQADTVTSPASFPLKPVSRAGDLPLSFAQQRLWFLEQLEPGNVAYNLPGLVFRLKDTLDEDALRKSLDEIIRRHEILRTTFRAIESKPVQVIASHRSIDLEAIDLRREPDSLREEKVLDLIAEELKRPFDLETGPLFRAVLFRLDTDDHILAFPIHHIVADGWSFGVFLRELSDLYNSFRAGKVLHLPDLPIQYADFAIWQRQWLQGEVMEAQLAYWKQQLKGEVPVLKLPTNQPRPPVQTYRGTRQSFVLPRRLSDALKSLSQREGVTLFMTLLAAFNTLLYHYTGQEDIAIGSPIANRNRAEIENLIGFFVNTLVLRSDMSGNPSFKELLGRVREVTLGAYDHQNVPFEKLVEELQPARAMSYSPLFQVMFVLQNIPMESKELPGLNLTPVAIEKNASMFDLTLFMWEGDQGLSGSVEYNTDLFDAERIERMVRHFQTLLEGIVANPGKCIGDLPIIDEAERLQLLVEWNDTVVEYPRDKCLHQLFEAQVERTPDAVAVVTETERLTYRQLNNRANRVAQRIMSLGVGPENIVGVLLDRSADMIAAILGILKAGGAYLPLDPEYPSDRLAFMLSDSQAQVLVTQSQIKSQLPEKCPEILYLDTDWIDTVKDSTENPKSTVQPNNLAYLLYTSGSTGLPKGVAIEHHSPMALICWAHTVFSENEMGGVLFSTSICFDLSVFEIFSPLTMGGKAILANNLLELPSLKAASEVTLINTVPSAIAELLRIEGIPPSVCTVNLAGELLKSSLVQEIYDVKSIKRVYDLYGPSEDTTYSTWVLRTSGGPQTIGRPISNTRIYILDQQRQLAPIGVAGELYLGGDGLARGYLHRPDLTSEKFIPNPFSEDPAARLYMTGDSARCFPDGTIEYLGRIDHQVKIRGFRIELGEVESVLGRHPAVEEAVVIAREDVQGDKRLVAYVVASHEPTPTFTELRSFLKEKLPDYMIPSAFVYIDSLPLTPNGKVDRRALPVPDARRPHIEEHFAAPRNAVEEALAEIWGEILRIEKVGIQDNFFELGGHSLMATQIISRISDVFRVEMPLRQLFLYPTIADLALIIAEKLEKKRQENVKQLLDEFEDLSDEEAERLLDQELRQKG